MKLGWTIGLGASLLMALSATAVPQRTYAAMGGGMSGGSSMEPSVPRAPNETSAYRRAEKLIKKEDYQGAIEKLDKLLEDAPNDADVLNLLGYSHRKLGHNDVALDFYKRALAQSPDHLGANEYLGELYLQMNDLTNAQAQQKKLAALCPTGCEEREDLDNAITAFQSKSGAATPPGRW